MITPFHFDYKIFTFPAGEPQVSVKPRATKEMHRQSENFASIHWKFENAGEVMELLLVCDALKRQGFALGTLVMPYIPFGRQDRTNSPYEALSLKVFADLINSLGFRDIVTMDPHSDVSRALFNNLDVGEQHDVFKHLFAEKKDFLLVSPDAGALKKIYKLAQITSPLAVIECSKHRDTATGEISGIFVHSTPKVIQGKECYIVDDICDGGRTFIEIAKVLKSLDAAKVVLCVSHGFFTKGLHVFNGLIDEVYTHEGKVYP